MRLIDCFSGREKKVGDSLGYDDGWTLLRVRDRLFFVSILVDRNDGSLPVWVECQVRILHPAFFGERIAFIPS